MYAYWVCAARETPIFRHKFPFWSISFSKMTKKSGPEHHNFNFFAVSETIIFNISLMSTRSSPPTAGSARTQSVRQCPGLVAGQSASQTRPGSSGDPHLKSRSRSIRLKLGPEPRIFTLDRGARSGARGHFSLCRGTYLPKFGVNTPSPPPPRE